MEHTKVVVCRVVQKDETETDWPASNGRPEPMDTWIGGPGKNEQPDRDEPAGDHHRNQTLFGGRLSVVLCGDLEVVLVDKRRTESTHDDSNGEGDEH